MPRFMWITGIPGAAQAVIVIDTEPPEGEPGEAKYFIGGSETKSAAAARMTVMALNGQNPVEE